MARRSRRMSKRGGGGYNAQYERKQQDAARLRAWEQSQTLASRAAILDRQEENASSPIARGSRPSGPNPGSTSGPAPPAKPKGARPSGPAPPSTDVARYMQVKDHPSVYNLVNGPRPGFPSDYDTEKGQTLPKGAIIDQGGRRSRRRRQTRRKTSRRKQ